MEEAGSLRSVGGLGAWGGGERCRGGPGGGASGVFSAVGSGFAILEPWGGGGCRCASASWWRGWRWRIGEEGDGGGASCPRADVVFSGTAAEFALLDLLGGVCRCASGGVVKGCLLGRVCGSEVREVLVSCFLGRICVELE